MCKNKESTDFQNFFYSKLKICCEACVEVLSLTYGNYVLYQTKTTKL